MSLNIPPSRRPRAVVLAGSIAAVLGCCFCQSMSHAANTWDGGGGNGNWSTALNWDDNAVPAFLQPLTFAGTTNLVTTNDLTGLTLNGVTFEVSAGAFKLQGNAVTLGGAITNNSTETQTFNFPITLAANQTVNAAAGSLLIGPGALGSGVISGSGGLTLTGAGTLTLGAVNTYSGDTTLDGGTLAYSVDNTVANLIWGTSAVAPFNTTPSALDLTNANLTAGSLAIRVNTTSPNTVMIGAGKTLTVNGPVTIGPSTTGLTDPVAVRTVLNVAGAGSLVVNSTGNFTVGQPRANADPGGDPQATVDLSLLNSFTYNADTSTGELRVGYGGNIAGTLRLAAGSNVITARVVQVGNSNNQNNGGTSTLSLGGATNLFQANTINIGSGKSPANFNFQGSTGSLSIVGQTNPTADLSVGTASSATASANVSNFNLAGHTANLQVGTLIIGRLSGSTAGIGGGSVTFDTGVFNVGNLLMAIHSSGGTNATTSGSLTIGGDAPNDTATGVFNVANQFLLVNRTSAAGTTAASTFTVNGGTANIGADILIVDNSPTAARTTTLNLAGGTLNMMGHSIATSILPVTTVNLPSLVQTATLANLGGTGINGAGLNMNGTGTLILAGANTYTGNTVIAVGGTLQIGASAAAGVLPADSVVMNDGALVFAGINAGTVSGAISGSGALTQSGSGTTTLSAANTYTGATTISGGTLSVTGSLVAASAVAVNAGGTLAGTGDGASTGKVGTVTMSAGSSLRPGATGAAGDFGKLTIAGLIVNGGNLQLDLGATSDLITILGTANFTAASTITPNASAPAGTYTLLTAGTLTLGVSPTLNAPTGTRKTFTADLATPNAIKLIITGTSKALTWTGANNGVWDLGAGGAPNWTDGTVAERFFNADTVIFGDGPTNRAITLNALVAPGFVMVNNGSGNDYSISGSGSVGGSTSVTKSGPGVLTLGTENTYTGATTVSGGSLALSGSISGTSALNVSGGSVRLAADNRINDLAPVTLGNGTFNSAGFSDTLGALTLSGTATLDLGGGASVLRFAYSAINSPAWTGILSITNWSGSPAGGGPDRVFFGTNGSGLAAAQLSLIQFVDPFGAASGTFAASILPTGEIVAIPEPASLQALIAGISAIFAFWRRPRRTA